MQFRAIFAIALAACASPVRAGTIIDEWNDAKAPPPPAIGDVEVEAKTTALLVMDFNLPICDPVTRPRCKAALPSVQKILLQARSKNMLVIYTLGGGGASSSVMPELKPVGQEPMISAPSDKFYNSDLEKLLKEKGMKTLIMTGVTSNGAVLFTSTAAVRRDFQVIVPVDGFAGDGLYQEQFSAWQLANSPGQAGKIKLTVIDRIHIK